MTWRLLVVVKLPVAYGGCPTVGGCRHPGLLANMQPAQAWSSLVWRSCRLAFQNGSFGTAEQAVSAPETVLVAGSHGWLCNVLPASRLRAHGAVRAINIKMLTAVSGRRQWQALPRVMLVGGVRYSAACVFTFCELHNKTWMNSFFQVVTVVNRGQAPLLLSWACGHGSSGHDLRCRGPVWLAQAFVGLPQLNVPGKLLARI